MRPPHCLTLDGAPSPLSYGASPSPDGVTASPSVSATSSVVSLSALSALHGSVQGSASLASSYSDLRDLSRDPSGALRFSSCVATHDDGRCEQLPPPRAKTRPRHVQGTHPRHARDMHMHMHMSTTRP